MSKKSKKRITTMESTTEPSSISSDQLAVHTSKAKKLKKPSFNKSFWKQPSIIAFVIVFAAIGGFSCT